MERPIENQTPESQQNQPGITIFGKIYLLILGGFFIAMILRIAGVF